MDKPKQSRKRRLSSIGVMVVQEFLDQKDSPLHGHDLVKSTGAETGTIYPLLKRLAEHEIIQCVGEAPSQGARTPKKLYVLKDRAKALQMIAEAPVPAEAQPAVTHFNALGLPYYSKARQGKPKKKG